MKRSPMVRKSPMRREGPSKERAEHARAKEAKPPKERVCICGATFTPRRMEHIVCSPRCLVRHKAAKAKAEREADRKRRDKLKTISQREAECRRIVQAIARIRDRADGCISCHMGPDYRGQWHGSHFRPAGNHSAVELHLWNIHKSCAQCNVHKGGNIAGYRPRLIEKIGIERVEWLESQIQVTKRTAEYLDRFKDVMGRRLRRMKKRHEL